MISSPVPYVISSGTVISTDPTITTNGTTDFGKIYRDSELDGPASLWFFGATSEFDNSIGFDEDIFVGDRAPVAAFKFSALSLIGDPTIVIGDGGPNNLALISVGDITSGPPGGPLTFSNLNLLFLATQDGSITLTSDLAFQNIPTLGIYARGAGSILTFDASVSGSTTLGLLSEGDIQVTNSLTVNETNAAGLTDGMIIDLSAGQMINVGGDLSLAVDASGIANGGTIDVASGADTTIGGLFGLTVSGSSGTIGNGGSIFASTGGNLTVGSLDFLLNYNVRTVSVTNGANIELSVGENLTTTAGGIDMLILTPFASSVGNGGNLTLSVGGDLSTGESDMDLRLVTSRGTQLGTGANLTASVGGNVVSNILSAKIENSRFGQIGTGGNLVFDVGDDLAASSLLLQLDNTDHGNIDLGGNITLTGGHDVTISGNADFFILNSDSGHIGTGGNIMVSTGGDFAAGTLNAVIDSSKGGSIDAGGAITFNIGGALTTSGDANVDIALRRFDSPAAIDFNGGTYEVGGTLRSTITGGDGGITIGTAAMHADIVKIGAFGNNGSLTIGGGRISGDTLLKLYAPGRNGTIDFVANVTLNSDSSVIIAGKTVTIHDNVVVTITGDDGVNASVYTNVPNYTGSGGNGSTSGIFAGNGATTQPLDQAPPFDDLEAPEAPPKVSAASIGTTAVTPSADPGLPVNRDPGADATISRPRPRVVTIRVSGFERVVGFGRQSDLRFNRSRPPEIERAGRQDVPRSRRRFVKESATVASDSKCCVRRPGA